MIRRFKDWQSDDDRRWQSSMRSYENYINEKKAFIPQALFDFIDRFTLHDGRITHIQEVEGVPTKKDAIITILSPKNG